MSAIKTDKVDSHAHRRQVLIQAVAKSEIDKLIVCDPLNLLYLSGAKFTPYERVIALVIEASSGAATMVLPELEKNAALDRSLQIESYRDDQDPFALLASILGPSRRLGVETAVLSLARHDALVAALKQRSGQAPPAIADIGCEIETLRLQKDEAEAALGRTAGRLSDEILATVVSGLVPGRSEKEIGVDLMRAMAAVSGVMSEAFVIQVLAGERSANPHGHSGDYRIEKGDPVTIDFGVCYEHYWSDCTRTFFVGPPRPEFEKIYRTVLKAQMAAIGTVRAEIPMAQIDQAARSSIAAAGYGERFIHRTGHGLGLDIHEPPSLHGANPAPLLAGMIVTIEPGIYVPGLGGVRIEDDVLVTDAGSRVLTGYPKSLEDMVLPV